MASSPERVQLSLLSFPSAPENEVEKKTSINPAPQKESENDRGNPQADGTRQKSPARKNSKKTSAKNELYQLSLLRFLSSTNSGSVGDQQPGKSEGVGERPGTSVPASSGTGEAGSTLFIDAPELATPEHRSEPDGDPAKFRDRDESPTLLSSEERVEDEQLSDESSDQFPDDADALLIELVPQNKESSFTNYRITPDDALGKGGASQKIKDNFAAIECLKKPEMFSQEERQKILVKYVGWGGLPQVFDPDNQNFEKERFTLSSLLNEKEFIAARRSTQDAHFTSETIVRGMWQAIQNMGLHGEIRALEPAMGTGNFLGLAPQALNISWHGIELDPTTAHIARLLYPEETIFNMSFAAFPSNASMFNLVIGNPPFGQQSLFDTGFSGPKNLSIHNYFLAKSISLLEPGGIAAFVVSRFFLDAKDTTTREYIAEQADFLGAIRLPTMAFQENALTQVTTDIVFFQKNTGTKLYPTDWVETTETFAYNMGKSTYPREKVVYSLNNWFHEHKDAIIGDMIAGHGMFQDSVDCVLYNHQINPTFKTQFNNAIQKFFPEQQIYKAVINEENKERIEQNLSFVQTEYFKKLKTGSFSIEPVSGAIISKCAVDIDLAEAFFETNEKTNFHLNWYTEVPCKPAQRKRFQAYIELRDTLRALFESEKINDAEKMPEHRQSLNQKYDAFVKNFGFLNASVNHSLFKDDPESSLVEALEKNYSKGISAETAKKKGIQPYSASAEKTDIFTQQVLFPPLVPSQNMSTIDTLFYCLHQHGRILPSVIAEIKGISEETIIEELLQSGRVFKNPATGSFETKEKYLSGDVKKKLQQALAVVENDKAYTQNVEALQNVLPADISPVDIGVQFGAAWLSVEVMKDFIHEVIYDDPEKKGCVLLSYSPFLTNSPWTFKNFFPNTVAETILWGIPEYPASNIINALLNNHSIKVEVENGSGSKVLDYDNTTLANQKAEKIKQAFADWIWKDDLRRETLSKVYNDTFNCHVPPQYDGSHFDLVNAAENITLRPHQKNAIWRGIQEGGGLFDHVVGAGKTMVAIAIIMESKRMGLCSKPMITVPNSLLYQWRDEFLRLYPNANVLVAEKTDFTKENRERLFSRIATGKWDAIIIGHSSFGRIAMPFNEQKNILEEEIRLLESVIIEEKKETGKSREIKKLEKKKESIQNNLKELLNKMNRTDRDIDFSDMGIDRLFVDESQKFKNLYFNTTQRVLGLGSPAGSAKAFDLFVKIRYLQRLNDNNSGVFFMTGTPISNTIAEMYTLQRYLQYETLQSKNIRTFDEWGKVFGKVVTGWELDASGAGYKLASRFAQFQNVPELLNMYRSVADVITQKDIDEQQKAQGLPPLTPPVQGGKPEGVIAERSMQQEVFMEDIIKRFANMPSDPREDNPLKATSAARKGGLDYRLVDPLSEDCEHSKINFAVENIFSIWEETKEQRGTQVVFCDLSTPKEKSSSYVFSGNNGIEKEISSDENTTFIKVLEELERETEESETQIENESVSNEAGEDSDDISLNNSGKFFSVYEDVRDKLISKGVPLKDIAFIHDAETDVQKARLFASLQTGSVRILMGSTEKMGAGVNIQRRLVAAHHLDMPWRPSDLEQRNGRIIRQKNYFFEKDPENFQVQIYYYLTKQMYDARMCQTLETKAYAIEQFRAGDMTQREIKDIRAEAATLAEMKAAASGNPLIFLEVELNTELQRLESLSKQYQRNVYALRNKIRQIEKYPEIIQNIKDKKERSMELLEKHTKFVSDEKGKTKIVHELSFEGKIYKEENKVAISNRLNAVISSLKTERSVFFATYRGLDINVLTQFFGNNCGYQFILSVNNEESYRLSNLSYIFSEKFSLSGFFTKIDNWLEKDFPLSFDYEIKRYEKEYGMLDKLLVEVEMPFQEKDKLDLVRFNHNSLLFELTLMQSSGAGQNSTTTSTWTPVKTIEEMQEKVFEFEQRKTSLVGEAKEQEETIEKLKDELLGKNREICFVLNEILLPEYDKTQGMLAYWRYPLKDKETFFIGNNKFNSNEYKGAFFTFEEIKEFKESRSRSRDEICEMVPIEKNLVGKIRYLFANEYERKSIQTEIENYGVEEYEKEALRNFPKVYRIENIKSILEIATTGEKTSYEIFLSKTEKNQNIQQKKGISL